MRLIDRLRKSILEKFVELGIPHEAEHELWMEFISIEGACCGLCGDLGVVNTTKLYGPHRGVVKPCICPRGRNSVP